jgi:hypothetical protein
MMKWQANIGPLVTPMGNDVPEGQEAERKFW